VDRGPVGAWGGAPAKEKIGKKVLGESLGADCWGRGLNRLLGRGGGKGGGGVTAAILMCAEMQTGGRTIEGGGGGMSANTHESHEQKGGIPRKEDFWVEKHQIVVFAHRKGRTKKGITV